MIKRRSDIYTKTIYSKSSLTLVMLSKLACYISAGFPDSQLYNSINKSGFNSVIENIVDPDQLASDKAS